MLRAADADGAVVELVGTLLGIGDQLAQRLHRQLGARHDDDGEDADHRDRLEILLGVIAEVLIERGVGGDRAGAGPHQGIAVGRGLGCLQRADIAAGARAVVDDEGLAQRLACPVEQDARDHVARAAAGKRNDHLDRPRRVGLRVGRGAGEDRRQNGDCAQRKPALSGCRHGFPFDRIFIIGVRRPCGASPARVGPAARQ